jgi:hypothetical protein
MGIIRALPLEHRVNDPPQLIGAMRERDPMVCASLALAVIDGVEHRIAAAGGERGLPDRPAQVGRPPSAHHCRLSYVPSCRSLLEPVLLT